MANIFTSKKFAAVAEYRRLLEVSVKYSQNVAEMFRFFLLGNIEDVSSMLLGVNENCQ